MNSNQPMLSRVADSLFWMSRYLERAENTSRQLDVYLNLNIDIASSMEEQRRLNRLIDSLTLPPEDMPQDHPLFTLTFDISNASSIIALITGARENARQVREQLSSEMWMQINKLHLHLRSTVVDSVWEAFPHDYYLQVRDGSHLFQGITDATMNHNQGWHFIQLGRFIERSIALLNLLDVHFDNEHLKRGEEISTLRYFELIGTLKSVTAFEAYTKVYSANVQSSWIIEFLLFNREFPRSLRFCVEAIQSSLNALEEMSDRARNSRLYRLAGRLQSQLSYDEIEDIHSLHDYLDNIKQQIYRIHDNLYHTYITYPIETAL
ncbi:MAG: alpha-E domain-containing protein [Anaerolineaceae bacterium]|nr:alpha-E domain-containing protein [Anaerolineaceae bacterium]